MGGFFLGSVGRNPQATDAESHILNFLASSLLETG